MTIIQIIIKLLTSLDQIIIYCSFGVWSIIGNNAIHDQTGCLTIACRPIPSHSLQ